MSGVQAVRGSDALSMGERVKAILGGSVGNLIEWFDFYVYNYAALYFAKSFFPNANPTVQYLNAFGIYAGAFFIRPVGSWILGAYADRAGRRASLSLSVVLMCGGSLMIALAPTYAEIGVWSPLILIAARLLQGISLGGEYGTSATYLSEVAGSKNRGFYSSFQYVTLVGGQVLGSASVLVLQMFYDRAGMEAGGWRIPFYIGAALAVFGFYLRRGLIESAEFEAVRHEPRRNPFSIFKTHPKSVALVFGLTMGGTTAFYTYTTYMPTFLVNTVKLTPDQATQISFITLLIFAAIQPIYGAISDRIGRRPVLMFFGVFGTICTYPILSTLAGMAGTKDYTSALLLSLAALFIVCGYTSINAVVKAELFPAKVRAFGVGFPYALANALFGGTAPYIALQLKEWKMESAFYWYVTVLIFISLLVYFFMADTKKTSLIDRD
jgi:MFS transporter, MHS family, alpha-ketoglutarate permease